MLGWSSLESLVRFWLRPLNICEQAWHQAIRLVWIQAGDWNTTVPISSQARGQQRLAAATTSDQK